MTAQTVSAEAAISRIRDGACLVTTGSGGGILEPDALLAALEHRFLETGHPRGLTFVHALGLGDRDRRGTNALAHAGMVKRVVGGHWTWSPRMMALADTDQIEAYSMPAGVITHLLRESGAGRPGLVTRTGLRTFADPRQRGCRANAAATDEVVELTTVEGREYLRYRPFRVDVALVRGTVADPLGNIGADQEPALLDALECAQAARGSGGITIAQVKRVIDTPLDPRRVSIPGVLVDFVIEAPEQRISYLPSDEDFFAPLDVSLPVTEAVENDPVRTVVARRAALEVRNGDTVNLGFGMSSGVADVLRAQGRLGDGVRLAIEQGLYDGHPATGDLFGMSRGPSARVSSATQFDLFSSGILDRTFLGMAQVDALGNVNVSRIAGRIIGPGGFVDISQYAREAVFCGSFVAKGTPARVEDGRLVLDDPAGLPKFVQAVEEITFSGELALSEGRCAKFVTERCVLELTPSGLELTEVAPGVDIDRDLLPFMGFEPLIRSPRQMPDEVFASLPTRELQEQT